MNQMVGADPGELRAGVPTRRRSHHDAHGQARSRCGDCRSAGRMPGAFLNPGAHTMLASAYEELNDDASARREQTLARLGVATILHSGDGTNQRPWEVLRVADEYDTLTALGRTRIEQRLHEVDGGRVDELVLDDGTRAWFVLV